MTYVVSLSDIIQLQRGFASELLLKHITVAATKCIISLYPSCKITLVGDSLIYFPQRAGFMQTASLYLGLSLLGTILLFR